MFFLLSGRRHLGGDIWKEASGRLSQALWELFGELSGRWVAMGASKASWIEDAANSLCFTTKTKKFNFA